MWRLLTLVADIIARAVEAWNRRQAGNAGRMAEREKLREAEHDAERKMDAVRPDDPLERLRRGGF